MYNHPMSLLKSPSASAQCGSALFMILIAVALFAALSFAISQQGDSGKSLSSEKTRLLASDIFDMGNKMVDVVAQMRLRGVGINQISFTNTIVTGYNNPACTTDKCKIFVYDGGGRDWETPAPDINGGTDWFYTGSLNIENMGTTAADLVAILPNLSLSLCTQLNNMVGITPAPSQFNSVVVDKFIGTFAAVPANLSGANVQGKISGCIKLDTPGGTAIEPSLPTSFYAYYQVLGPR